MDKLIGNTIKVKNNIYNGRKKKKLSNLVFEIIKESLNTMEMTIVKLK